MRATDIKGLFVRPEGTDDVTGTVGDIVLDLDERRLLALTVTRADNETVYVLDIGDIVDADDRGVTARQDAAILPLADTRRYDTMPTFGRMLEEKAMTESGRILGKLADIDIDLATWRVTAYQVVGSADQVFEHGEQRLSPDQLVSAGAHVLLVSESAAEAPESTGGQ